MRLYQRLAIVGTTLFELLTPIAYAAPPQPVQPETTVCLPLSEFEKLCLPKPNHPTRPTHPVTPKRPKVPATSERCDEYFNGNSTSPGYTGACITDVSILKDNDQLDIIEGPRNLCPGASRCYGIKVIPQAPVVEKVEVRVEVPVIDKGAQDKIDELRQSVSQLTQTLNQPKASEKTGLKSAVTLQVYGPKNGLGINAGYQAQISPRVTLGIKGGYLHINDPESTDTVTTGGQLHDLTNGIQEIVDTTHTATSYQGRNRGTVGVEADIELYHISIFRFDTVLGLEAVMYQTGEGSQDQRDAYLIQNGQRTTDTKTATTRVLVDKHVTADITSYLGLEILLNFGGGFKVGPTFGLGVTFPNMSTDDVRVGGRYGVKSTYEF